MNWMDEAACRNMDTSIFFPEYALRETTEPAIAVCRNCPVTSECLDHAKKVGASHGIWGGTLVGNRSSAITPEEEQEILEGVKEGLATGWTIEQTAKHLKVNLQRAKKYQRIIEAARPQEPETPQPEPQGPSVVRRILGLFKL